MTDNLSAEQRSYAMSRIRSRGNQSTEQALIGLMRSAGIAGWRRGSTLTGKPDFVFPRVRVAVFVDGCYWHGCARCALRAKSNRAYWSAKIAGNRERDYRNARRLRAAGWSVLRIWEHDMKGDPAKCIRKVMAGLRRAEWKVEAGSD